MKTNISKRIIKYWKGISCKIKCTQWIQFFGNFIWCILILKQETWFSGIIWQKILSDTFSQTQKNRSEFEKWKYRIMQKWLNSICTKVYVYLLTCRFLQCTLCFYTKSWCNMLSNKSISAWIFGWVIQLFYRMSCSGLKDIISLLPQWVIAWRFSEKKWLIWASNMSQRSLIIRSKEDGLGWLTRRK